LPSPEAGLAIESRSIIPYIFEPAPFEPLLSSEFQTFYGGDYYYRSQGSATGGGHPEAASLRHDPLPPVEVPGVTESELVEMWGLLEDETVGYDLNGKDENASTSTAQPNWPADPTELVNQWASLNGKSILAQQDFRIVLIIVFLQSQSKNQRIFRQGAFPDRLQAKSLQNGTINRITPFNLKARVGLRCTGTHQIMLINTPARIIRRTPAVVRTLQTGLDMPQSKCLSPCYKIPTGLLPLTLPSLKALL
jgi:hypothetical protein